MKERVGKYSASFTLFGWLGGGGVNVAVGISRLLKLLMYKTLFEQDLDTELNKNKCGIVFFCARGLDGWGELRERG